MNNMGRIRGGKGSNKVSKWSSGAKGMRRHAKSGVPTNHANSIARTREVNRELEKAARLREKLRLRFLEKGY